MTEIVSYVCVRADHQWGTADGIVRPLNGSLAYCPDRAAADGGHAWQECGAVTRAEVDALLARVQTERSAIA